MNTREKSLLTLALLMMTSPLAFGGAWGPDTLLTGLSGGQTVIGGTAASDKLTITSTSNSTKGNITFQGATANTTTTYIDPAGDLNVGANATITGSSTVSGNVTINGTGIFQIPNGSTVNIDNTGDVGCSGLFYGLTGGTLQFLGPAQLTSGNLSFIGGVQAKFFNAIGGLSTGSIRGNGGTSTGNTTLQMLPVDQFSVLKSAVIFSAGNSTQTAGFVNINDQGTLNATKGETQHVNAKSTNYTVTVTDHYVPTTTGSSTIVDTLPAATGSGIELVAKKIDSGAGTVVVTAAGSDTIDGNTTYTLSAQYNAVEIIDRAAGVWDIEYTH